MNLNYKNKLFFKNGLNDYFQKQNTLLLTCNVNKRLATNSSSTSFAYTLFDTPIQNDHLETKYLTEITPSYPKHSKNNILINLNYYFGLALTSLGK